MPETIHVTVKIGAPPRLVADLLRSSSWSAWIPARGGIEERRLRLVFTDGVVSGGVEDALPDRLSFTWGWEGADQVPQGSSDVVVTLAPNGHGGTILDLRHAGLPFGVDRVQAGLWHRWLDRLRVVAETAAH